MKKKILLTLLIMVCALNLLTIPFSNAADGKVVENGNYRISMFEDSHCHQALEIANGSKQVTANVQVGNWVNKDNEKNKFKLIYDSKSGYYEIESVISGKLLDVQNGGMTSGTNVWQHTRNGTDAQKWKIQKNSDGSYSIISKKNGLYLNLQNYQNGGTNITVNSKNNSQSQKFKILSLDKVEAKVIEDGIYKVQTSADSNKVMEVKDESIYNGTNIQVGNWVDIPSKKFQFVYNKDDGYYTIKSISSGKVLDAQNGGMTAGTNVWQYSSNYTDAQRWKVVKNNDGTYSFMCKKNGLYVNVNNNNIELSKKSSNASQKFKLVSATVAMERTVDDGKYRISMFEGSHCHQALEIANGSKQVTANVQVGNWVNKDNEKNKFKLIYDSKSGYYEIESVISGKLLDVENGGMTSGTNVWQHARNGTDAQKWRIQKNSDGSYNIVSKKNGLYLNLQNYQNGGTNITVNSKNNSQAQKFNLISLDKVEAKVVEDGTYKIQTSSDSNKVMEVKDFSTANGANIQVGNWTNVSNKKFELIYNKDDGYYTIKSVGTGKVLDAQNGGMTSGTNVWQYSGNYTDAQRWKVVKNDDGTYSFMCKKNGLYVNVNNNNIELASKSNNASQKFKLASPTDKVEQPTDTTQKPDIKSEKVLEDGLYKVLTKSNNSIGFDIESASKNNGGILQIWKYENVKQQQFNLTFKDGYYIIVNKNSNKALQVSGNKIIQYEINEKSDAQKWIITKTNGYYSIVSKETGKCIAIPNGNVSNGVDLQVESNNKKDNQLFKFEKLGITIDESKYPGIKQKIEELQNKYPNWNFELLYTGVKFADAVNGEYSTKRNSLMDTSVYRGEWVAENPYHSGNWYSASYKGVAYFLDTRNFLNDVDIFQFLDLNGYNNESISYDAMKEQVQGTFLQNYVNDICNACKKQNVNPYYVLARLFQEQGRYGTTIGTGMDGKDGKKYYNPFNIGAQVGNDYETALSKAKEKGWDSMEKAIIGGIDFLKANWLSNYQNTLYQNKFDIDKRNGTSLYTHEYMQNLSAAYSEARALRSCYTSDQIKNSSFTFIIPIYENMPSQISAKPINSSAPISTNSGPKDAKIANISTYLRLRETASTSANVIAELKNGTHVLSIKRAVNGNWNQVVTDDGKIGYVSGDYLQFIADKTNCNTKKSVKTADGTGIRIRIGPSIKVDQSGTLADGQTVTVISTGIYKNDGYDWDRIVLSDGRQAFAPAKYLK